ncbi:hypothetical protein IHE45_05G002400 [Dioscorea alata]|uniref:Uncharacterized protein n=1 Tax=Dioscorea alata TaxID=55571 RepID=A0ACB7VZ19_DIOAL|nr:hypothetical protein IHE45_05G002400 [Dioscorea alata]
MRRFLSAIDEAAEDFAGVIKSACRGDDDDDARRSKHSRGRPRTSRMMTRERVHQAEMNQMRMMMMSREYSRAYPPMHHPPTRRLVNPNSQLGSMDDSAYLSGASAAAGIVLNRLTVFPDQAGGSNTYEHHDSNVYNIDMHLHLHDNYIGALNLSNKEKVKGQHR